ncbi:MAG: N-acetylglucosamine-6-phosphate deacetylase [Ginsengibacter sp.]
MQVYTADKIFTGSEWLNQHAVITEKGRIKEIVPFSSLTGVVKDYRHAGILAPAFIDLQVYGAGNRLFALYPDTDSLQRLYKYCVAGGTNHFLPTVATNTLPVIHRCIDAIKAYGKANGKGVPGLHLEGPWINPAKRGAHIEALIHPPSLKEVEELLQRGKGVIKMITLAPEVCSQDVIDLIVAENVIISAGHSNATYREGIHAFNNGIPVATHLFNAMRPFHHRDAGLPGAVMHHPAAMASIIPDGYHVDFEVISMAKKLMKERLFIITDAVTETNAGPYPHSYREGRYEANGILSGSAITMVQGIKNLVDRAGIDLSEALRMASLYPARVLGLDHELGMIEPGFRESFVFLDETLSVVFPKI